MHSAKFTFADGASFALSVEDGQTVLEAAMQADAPIRYDCIEGRCGACIAHCVSGAADVGPGVAMPVSAAEYAAGLRPTCLTRLASDAAFDLPYPSKPVPSDARRLKGRVVEVGMAAATVHRLVIALDRAEGLSFQSGQYLRVRPPGAAAARAYSIASTVADLPRVELLIRHVAGGAMSEWLKTVAAPGDLLTVQAPLGAFGLDINARRHVFVAGGTGLAPVLSMARTLPPGDTALLCFGCTREDDLFHMAELNDLVSANPAVELRVALMQPGSSAHAEGTAVSLLRADDLADLAATYYLCGPPPMVEASRARLAEASVPIDRIRAERFAPGG